MPLKWKIFLVSLVLVMAAVSATTLSALYISFSGELEAVRSSAVQDHGYLRSAMQNRVAIEKLDSGLPLLTNEKLATVTALSVISHMSRSSQSGICGAVVLSESYGKNTPIASFGESPEMTKLPTAEDIENSKTYSVIYEKSDEKHLAVCSLTSLNNDTLYVYSVYDVSRFFAGYRTNILTAGAVSIGLSIVISVILFAVTSKLLKPFSEMNEVLRNIAGGNYSHRVSPTGGHEEKEMAESINTMAEAIEDRVHKLENIAEGRKRFVDNLAHEMKTPLTSILCFGDLLRIKRSVTNAERLEYAGVIFDEAQRLKNLSSKLLELACADKMELDMEPSSVSTLLDEAVAAISPALASQGISLEYSGDDGTILCDRELFKSLIYNLCDNAAKASEKGQKVTLHSKLADNGIIISVTDHGIGMTAEVLKKVTEPFYMADKSRSRKAGGAGLGLSLCVEIAKRHNARLTAKSRPGSGTSIFITVPIAPKNISEKR